MRRFSQKHALSVAWTQATLALVGSLFFSLVLNLPPCDLCWYQRICIYPLVLIIGVGIVKKNKHFLDFAIPLAVIGWLFALYHNLLYYGFIPEALAPCKVGVSCTTRYFDLFGFISIPFLSLCAFSLIIVCLFGYRKYAE